MPDGNGVQPPATAEKSLGEIVTDVSEKASLLVREEIELAKAEVQEKISKLAKGAVAGILAATFAFFSLVILLHAVAWFFVDLLDIQDTIWLGFLITFGILIFLALISALLARRLIRRGAPPTPDLAIEEAKRTRQTFERHEPAGAVPTQESGG
jgi:uncharacterized membrane protein YqjE